MIVYVVGMTTSGDVDESPSLDTEVWDSRERAVERLRAVIEAWKPEPCLLRQLDAWAGSDDERRQLYIDDGLCTLYFIVPQLINQPLIV